MTSKPRWVSRRHDRGGEKKEQIQKAGTFDEAIRIARRWYASHGIGYGILIKYRIAEIGELVRVRDFYLVNSEADIK